MKTVIEMAREAGFDMPQGESFYQAWPEEIERFAELVRAAAIKEAPDYLMGYADGVHVEREECAKVCEEPGWNAANWCAKAIRERNNT